MFTFASDRLLSQGDIFIDRVRLAVKRNGIRKRASVHVIIS